MKKTKWIFISFLFGGVIGSAIALLYAPESGKHLRKDISRKTNELIDEGKKKTSEFWNSAREKAESTFETANDALNSGVEKIMRKKEKVEDAVKSGFDAYNKERTKRNKINE
jgi:gas vesicle protein